MNKEVKKRRAIVLVIDGLGVGAAPDCEAFGDSPSCNTLANVVAATAGLKLPNLQKLGLGNILPLLGIEPVAQPQALFGKLQESSAGKDTQTGHWEMMGIISHNAFPTYPQGFPQKIIRQFIKETGCKEVLGNKPASGTVIIEELGPAHQATGFPIVYTSADSVFQIACHVDVIPLPTLYMWCETARIILQGPHRIGRVIARPFTGELGNYQRLSFERRDYGVPPPEDTVLDKLSAEGYGVLGIGKIQDIFANQGISHACHTGTNREGLELTLAAIEEKFDLPGNKIVTNAPNTVQLIFTNLVDTDMLYGHRRNAQGYAQALREIDRGLDPIIKAMQQEDLLIISSDHGNDPTASGTDHTREFVPLIAYAKSLEKASLQEKNLGCRQGFADIAASLVSWFGIAWGGSGVSFLPQLSAVH